MKKLYYKRNKSNVLDIELKQFANNTIFAKNFEDAVNKFNSKHLKLTKSAEKKLFKIFTSNQKYSEEIFSNLNNSIEFILHKIVTCWKNNLIKILSTITVTGIFNYFLLNNLEIIRQRFDVIIKDSLMDKFINIPIVFSMFCLLWLMFLIPRKRYNVISIFLVIIMDLIGFWQSKDFYIVYKKTNVSIFLDQNSDKNILFLIFCFFNVLVISFVIVNVLEEIYKWIIGDNKEIETPKLSLIWAILAFLLGLLFKK